MEESPRSSHIKAFMRLLSQAVRGSEEAWERLFERIEKAVRRGCQFDKLKIRKIRLRDSDLVQEVGTRAFQKLRQFRGKTPQEFVIWVTAITQNLINDYYREFQSSKRGAGKEISLESLKEKADELPAERDEAELDEARMAEALEALGQLSEPYHRAIELRIVEGLTFQEIGERLYCTEDAARMMFHRAVQIIREKLKERE